ncbi:hypothetical protein L6452_12740 [Arctium lappa]|uniref:Uncharacterized protein n=1 Tax=Arctium lappa TaxID=4217 RepID=A0ACB9CG76_ARCLA|nr:hypothetical protein L6452_12740 [Arctium lappa]
MAAGSGSMGNKISYDKKSVGGVASEVESNANVSTPFSAKISVFEQAKVSVSSSSEIKMDGVKIASGEGTGANEGVMAAGSGSMGNKISYDKKSVGGVALEVESNANVSTPFSAKISVFEQAKVSVSSSSEIKMDGVKIASGEGYSNVKDSGVDLGLNLKSNGKASSGNTSLQKNENTTFATGEKFNGDSEPVLEQVVDYNKATGESEGMGKGSESVKEKSDVDNVNFVTKIKDTVMIDSGAVKAGGEPVVTANNHGKEDLVFGHKEMICEKRPRTEAELAAAAAKTQVTKENVKVKEDDGFQVVGKKNRVVKVEGQKSRGQGLRGMGFGSNASNRGVRYGENRFRPAWVGNGQKGEFRRDVQQKGGSSTGPQSNKQRNFEKGESSGVIKNGSGISDKNSNGRDGTKGKVNIVVNNSGNLELKKKEEKNKDKAGVGDGKGQVDGQKKENKGKEEVKVDSKKGNVSDFSGNNLFDVLMEVDAEEWEIRKGKVDLFLKMNNKPSKEMMDGWDEEMMKYYNENVVDDAKEDDDIWPSVNSKKYRMWEAVGLEYFLLYRRILEDMEKCEREGILSITRYKIWKEWAIQHCIDKKVCPQEDEFNRWDLGMRERFIKEFVKWYEIDPAILGDSFFLIYSLQFYIDHKIMPPDEVYNMWTTEQRVKFTDEYMTWDGWYVDCLGDVLENGHGEGPCKDCS